MPAVLQIEDMAGDFNRHYHSSADTLEHMDAAYFVAQVRALAAVVERLAGGAPDPPRPTDPPTPADPPTPTEEPRPTDSPRPTGSPVTWRLYAPSAASGSR